MSDDQLGFVTVDDIRNVFIVELEKLEKNYRLINPTPPDYKTILEDIDDIRRALLARARLNMKRYVESHPSEKKKAHEAKKVEEAQKDTRDWQDRVKANRQEAIRDAYREPSGS